MDWSLLVCSGPHEEKVLNTRNKDIRVKTEEEIAKGRSKFAHSKRCCHVGAHGPGGDRARGGETAPYKLSSGETAPTLA